MARKATTRSTRARDYEVIPDMNAILNSYLDRYAQANNMSRQTAAAR